MLSYALGVKFDNFIKETSAVNDAYEINVAIRILLQMPDIISIFPCIRGIILRENQCKSISLKCKDELFRLEFNVVKMAEVKTIYIFE